MILVEPTRGEPRGTYSNLRRVNLVEPGSVNLVEAASGEPSGICESPRWGPATRMRSHRNNYSDINVQTD